MSVGWNQQINFAWSLKPDVATHLQREEKGGWNSLACPCCATIHSTFPRSSICLMKPLWNLHVLQIWASPDNHVLFWEQDLLNNFSCNCSWSEGHSIRFSKELCVVNLLICSFFDVESGAERAEGWLSKLSKLARPKPEQRSHGDSLRGTHVSSTNPSFEALMGRITGGWDGCRWILREKVERSLSHKLWSMWFMDMPIW